MGCDIRSEAEIRAMVAALTRFNDAIALELATCSDEHLHTFNTNAMLLCALQWALGEDTMRHAKIVDAKCFT